MARVNGFFPRKRRCCRKPDKSALFVKFLPFPIPLYYASRRFNDFYAAFTIKKTPVRRLFLYYREFFVTSERARKRSSRSTGLARWRSMPASNAACLSSA